MILSGLDHNSRPLALYEAGGFLYADRGERAETDDELLG